MPIYKYALTFSQNWDGSPCSLQLFYVIPKSNNPKITTFLPGIHKEDKQRIKQQLYHFLPDMFYMPRGELSDDEGDQDEEMDTDESERLPHMSSSIASTNSKDRDQKSADKDKKPANGNKTVTTPIITPMVNGTSSDSEKDQDPTVSV